MKKLTLLVIALFLLTIAAPVFAGPFQDVKAGHWAYEAIRTLSAKGVLEGYPNNKFQGNKAMTRYEVAQMVARLIEVGGLGGDYSTLQKLTIEFADELALLGVKVTALEDDVKMLRMEQEDMRARLGHMGMGKIKVTAEARTRFESLDYDLNSTLNNVAGAAVVASRNANNNMMRFRLNMSALVDENVAAYFSFQDNTTFNTANQNNRSVAAPLAGVNRNIFLGYVDIKNFGTLVDNFRFGRQTVTIGKGLIIDDELDGMLVRKDYRGTVFHFGAFEVDNDFAGVAGLNSANDGLNFKIFTVDHAWDRIAAGLYYGALNLNQVDADADGIIEAGNKTVLGLTIDAKLGKDVVGYIEYVKEEDKDRTSSEFLTAAGVAGRDEDATAVKVGVEWTINKYYDLSVLYQKRDRDFRTLAHNDDYSDSVYYGNAAIAGMLNKNGGALVDGYNNSKIMSVIFGAKVRDDLQLDIWYEKLEGDATTAIVAGVNYTGNFDQSAMQAIATYQYRDNTAFKLRYRTVKFDDGDTDYTVLGAGGPADYTQVRLDMNVKF